MNTKEQGQALSALAEVWALAPEVRHGQLFAHLGFLGEAHLGRGLGYIDDDELLSIIAKHHAELLARQDSPNPPLEQAAAATASNDHAE